MTVSGVSCTTSATIDSISRIRRRSVEGLGLVRTMCSLSNGAAYVTTTAGPPIESGMTSASPPGLRQLEVRRLGLVGYDEALALQRELVEERRADRFPISCCCWSIRRSSRLASAPRSHVPTSWRPTSGSHSSASRFTRRVAAATSRITAPARSSATRSSICDRTGVTCTSTCAISRRS